MNRNDIDAFRAFVLTPDGYRARRAADVTHDTRPSKSGGHFSIPESMAAAKRKAIFGARVRRLWR
jgi:hypothetical protein